METIWIGSDNTVAVTSLKNAVTDAYINDATVTFTLRDRNGVAVVLNGQAPYVAGSNGNYRGILEDTNTVSLIRQGQYTLEISIVDGPGYTAYYEVDCCAMVRDENG